MIGVVGRQLLRGLHRVLTLLVPTVPDRICYLSSPDYGDNAYYQFRHLLTSATPREHVWLVNDAASLKKVLQDFPAAARQRGHTLYCVRKGTLRGYLFFLRARWVFYSHGLYGFARSSHRRTVVCLWHGMPIKNIGALQGEVPARFLPFGDVHVASSAFFRYVIACAFRVPPGRVHVTGLPRCDVLMMPNLAEFSRQDVRARLGLPSAQKLVLWLPTFRQSQREAAVGSSRARSFLDDVPAQLLRDLGAAAAAHNCRVVIKLHPKDSLNQRGSQAPETGIDVLGQQQWSALGLPLYDVLAAADGLISDVSSVLVDFLPMGRPIGLLGYDAATYNRQLSFPIEWLLAEPHVHALEASDDRAAFFAATGRVGAESPARAGQEGHQLFHRMGGEPSGAAIARIVGLAD